MTDQPEEVAPSGRRKGGIARRDSLTQERRSEIAREAAAKRWGTNLPQAEFGSPERPIMIGDVELQCYVLDDQTRVLARAGVLKAIGRTGKAKGGRAHDEGFQTPVFLTAANLKPFISEEILGNSKPIIFRAPNGTESIGYRAEFLPQVCEVFMDAADAGKLRPNQMHIAAACKALHRSFARIGIIGLVDEATGFQHYRERDALQAFLDKFLKKELAAWVRTFPDEFFTEIYRLRNWKWKGSSRKPGVVGKYINDLIYSRLGPGVLDELQRRNPVNEKGRRKAKHHQWLTTDIGHPALAQHMYATIGFMRASDNWESFKTGFYRAFPKKNDQLTFELKSPPAGRLTP